MFGEARAPAVTQDSLVARPATGYRASQTATVESAESSGGMTRPSVFAGTSARVPALLVILIRLRDPSKPMSASA
jgi:hypothetical protein